MGTNVRINNPESNMVWKEKWEGDGSVGDRGQQFQVTRCTGSTASSKKEEEQLVGLFYTAGDGIQHFSKDSRSCHAINKSFRYFKFNRPS